MPQMRWNLPCEVNKQKEEEKKENRYARSLKCKIESMAINNTITRVCMRVAVGQIWIQAALLDSKQERERSIEKKLSKKKNNANNKQ